MLLAHIEGLSGLAAAALFILGLKRMSSPVTALSGFKLAGIGMLVAVLAGFLILGHLPQGAGAGLVLNLTLALAALALGGGWAWPAV